MGYPWVAHVLHMGCPLKQWAAQWTGAAHCLCQLIIISAHGLHMGSSVDRSYPLTFNLIIISDHGLPMGSSDCQTTQWAVKWAAPTLSLRNQWAVGNSNIGFHHASEINYTVVVSASWEDIYCQKVRLQVVSQQKTSNCVLMLEAGIQTYWIELMIKM